MTKTRHALMLASLLAVSFNLPTSASAQDLLHSTIEKMQNGMDALVGDGVFDIADEDICLNVLGSSSYQTQAAVIEAIGGELTDVMARVRVGTLANSAIEKRTLFLYLRDVIEEKREVPRLKGLSKEETEAWSPACSVLVKGMLEDISAEVALQTRGRAEQWVLSEVIAAFAAQSGQ